jgi:hypothetical protein
MALDAHASFISRNAPLENRRIRERRGGRFHGRGRRLARLLRVYVPDIRLF